MKKVATLLLLMSLPILAGCSDSQDKETPTPETPVENSIRDDKFEGVNGTYEWIESFVHDTSKPIMEGHVKLLHVLLYTNTTNQAVMPGEVLHNEMVLQHETDIELNDVSFQTLRDYEEDNLSAELKEMVDVGYKNIKPGVTVKILAASNVEKSRVDLLYLRNRIKHPGDTVVYEKKITLKNPDDLDKFYP